MSHPPTPVELNRRIRKLREAAMAKGAEMKEKSTAGEWIKKCDQCGDYFDTLGPSDYSMHCTSCDHCNGMKGSDRRQSDRDPPAVAQVEPTGGMLAPSGDDRQAELLKFSESHPPPQAWYDEDFTGLIAERWPIEDRKQYACDVCGNWPDEYGELEHGRGCRVVDEDGGGSTYVTPPDDEPDTDEFPLPKPEEAK